MPPFPLPSLPSVLPLSLSPAKEVSFKFPNEIQVIPCKQAFSVPPGTQGLILPRSDAYQRGLFVVPLTLEPGQYTPVHMQVWANTPQILPVEVSPAVLILIPVYTTDIEDPLVGFSTAISERRPKHKFWIEGQEFDGLLDTGADVSVIPRSQWPPSWPLDPCPSVWGVGGRQTAFQSASYLSFSLPGSSAKVVKIKPYVLPIPLCLWGRDLLSQLGAHLSFDDE